VDRLRSLGNAVVPPIVEAIGAAILEHAERGYVWGYFFRKATETAPEASPNLELGIPLSPPK
jgi:hypothetical protein